MIRRILRWLTGGKRPPEDPHGYVRQPVRRGPPSRAAGVALAEPPPRRTIGLFGFRLR